MDLYLEPPWAYINYVTHVSWTVTFVDELPLDEQLPPSLTSSVSDDTDESLDGAAT